MVMGLVIPSILFLPIFMIIVVVVIIMVIVMNVDFLDAPHRVNSHTDQHYIDEISQCVYELIFEGEIQFVYKFDIFLG